MSLKGLKPRLFIGSAGESRGIARKVQTLLQEDAEVTIWDQEVFKLGDFTLERLLQILDTFDFAVFIFTPDDLSKIRLQSFRVTRDNVVLELGLFLGKLGRKRCFLLAPKNRDLHLPTDLLGLNVARYDPDRQDKNMAAALGPPCDQIRDLITEQGRWNPAAEEASKLLVDQFKMYLASRQVEQPTALKRLSLSNLRAQRVRPLGKTDR